MSFNVLERNVIDWGRARNIIGENAAVSPMSQVIKTMEEAQETIRAVHDKDTVGVVDGIGDVLVTLILLADMYDTDVTSCLRHAYNEIKDRKGKTVNGMFIKDAN